MSAQKLQEFVGMVPASTQRAATSANVPMDSPMMRCLLSASVREGGSCRGSVINTYSENYGCIFFLQEQSFSLVILKFGIIKCIESSVFVIFYTPICFSLTVVAFFACALLFLYKV